MKPRNIAKPLKIIVKMFSPLLNFYRHWSHFEKKTYKLGQMQKTAYTTADIQKIFRVEEKYKNFRKENAKKMVSK